MEKNMTNLQLSLQANQHKFYKLWRVAMVLTMCISMFCALSCTVFADDGIVSNIASGMGEMFQILRAIVIPVAVIALVFAGYQVLMGGEKGMETAKKTVVSIIVAVALVMVAPLILEQVAGWFGDASENQVFSDPENAITQN